MNRQILLSQENSYKRSWEHVMCLASTVNDLFSCYHRKQRNQPAYSSMMGG